MQKYKNKIIYSIGFITIILLSAFILQFVIYQYVIINLKLSHKFWGIEAYAITEITVPKIKKIEPIKCEETIKHKEPIKTISTNLKSRILAEFEKNGINPTVADCVIQGESGWREKIFSPDGRDGGLMQWRDIHIKSGYLTEECRLDADCSAKKAIEKVKNDGGWGAWMAYKNNNCGRLGKTLLHF